MRLKTIVIAVFIGAALCLTSTAQDVEYHAAPGTDFTVYKTYKWVRAPKASHLPDNIDQIMKLAADAQLIRKGLSRTDSDQADLYISYELAIFEDMTWNSFTTEVGWYSMDYGMIASTGSTTNSSYKIKRGFMIMEILDVKQKKTVWQMEARKVLREDKDLKKIEKNARKAMAKIFKNYPPAG